MIANLFLLALLLPVLPPRAQAAKAGEPDLQTKLRQQVSGYDLQANNFLAALLKIADHFQIPMGIEWVRTPATLVQVHRTWKSGTVDQVVTILARSQPGYGVRVSNGVLHVFVQNLHQDPDNFLNIRLDKFEVDNQYLGVARGKLLTLVHQRLFPPSAVSPTARPKEGDSGGSLFIGQGDRQVSFQETNATVRSILDKLSLAADFRVWVVTFSQGRAIPGTGFLRTASPLTGRPIGDSAQPFWELLMWGENPY